MESQRRCYNAVKKSNAIQVIVPRAIIETCRLGGPSGRSTARTLQRTDATNGDISAVKQLSLQRARDRSQVGNLLGAGLLERVEAEAGTGQGLGVGKPTPPGAFGVHFDAAFAFQEAALAPRHASVALRRAAKPGVTARARKRAVKWRRS